VTNESGSQIASCSNDQTLRLWDFRTGESKMEFRGHEHVVECLTFAPASAIETIKELLASSADTKTPGVVVPKNPDQGYLLSGSRDRTIKLWDTITGQCVFTFVSTFSPVFPFARIRFFDVDSLLPW